MAAGFKLEHAANGNIALRIFSNQGGVVRLTKEMVFTPAVAEKVGARLVEMAKAAQLAQAGAASDEEFENLDDEDLDDEGDKRKQTSSVKLCSLCGEPAPDVSHAYVCKVWNAR